MVQPDLTEGSPKSSSWVRPRKNNGCNVSRCYDSYIRLPPYCTVCILKYIVISAKQRVLQVFTSSTHIDLWHNLYTYPLSVKRNLIRYRVGPVTDGFWIHIAFSQWYNLFFRNDIKLNNHLAICLATSSISYRNDVMHYSKWTRVFWNVSHIIIVVIVIIIDSYTVWALLVYGLLILVWPSLHWPSKSYFYVLVLWASPLPVCVYVHTYVFLNSNIGWCINWIRIWCEIGKSAVYGGAA
jgi:hypothetical protein